MRPRRWRRYYVADRALALHGVWQSVHQDFKGASAEFDFDMLFTNLYVHEFKTLCRLAGLHGRTSTHMVQDAITTDLADPWLREVLGLSVETDEDHPEEAPTHVRDVAPSPPGTD